MITVKVNKNASGSDLQKEEAVESILCIVRGYTDQVLYVTTSLMGGSS